MLDYQFSTNVELKYLFRKTHLPPPQLFVNIYLFEKQCKNICGICTWNI